MQSNVPGVTDTEIKLGGHTFLASSPGNVMPKYSLMALAAKAYFAKVNDEGGVHGRRIEYVVRDGGVNALEVVRTLVEEDKIFAAFGNSFFPHLSSKDYLADKGVPDFGVMNGNAIEGTPVCRTRFIGPIPELAAEGRLLAQWVVRKYRGKKVNIATIAQNNVWGWEQLRSVGEEASSAGIPIDALFFDRATQDMTQQIAHVLETKPDVVFILSSPEAFLPHIKNLTKGPYRPQLLASSPNQQDCWIEQVGPDAMDALVVTHSWPRIDMKSPAVLAHIEMLKKYAPELTFGEFTLAGQVNAEIMVEILERTGPKPTRELAAQMAETIKDWRTSLSYSPVSYSAHNHRTLDSRDLRLLQVREGRFVPVTD